MPDREEGSADPVQGRAGGPEPAVDASRGTADRQGRSGRSGGRGERLSAGLATAAGGARSGLSALVGSGLRSVAVLALSVAAFGVLIAAELSPVYTIDVGGLPCDRVEFTLTDLCAPSGFDRHSVGLVLLGLFGVLLAGLVVALSFWESGLRPTRIASAALALVGIAIIAIVLVSDLPDVNQTGEIGLRFDEAEANPADGFYLSLLGGALALAGGVLGLVRRR